MLSSSSEDTAVSVSSDEDLGGAALDTAGWTRVADGCVRAWTKAKNNAEKDKKAKIT